MLNPFYFFTEYFFPLAVIGLIVYLIARSNKKARLHALQNTATPSASKVGAVMAQEKKLVSDAFSDFTVTKEDAISQVYLIITIGLFGLLLSYLNYFFDRPVTTGVIAFIVIAVALGVAYYFRLLVLALISLVSLFFWWGFQGAHWTNLIYGHWGVIVGGFLLLSAVFCALGYAHLDTRAYKRLAVIYLTFGIIGVTIILIFYSTQTGLEFIFNTNDLPVGMHGVRLTEVAKGPAWQALISMALGAVVFIVAVVRAAFRKTISAVELGSLVIFAGLAIAMTFVQGSFRAPSPETQLLWGSSTLSYSAHSDQPFTTAGRVWAILLNMALILEALVFLFIGYMRQKASWVNLATGALFVILFVKYIDWFYDSLDKEYFFIGAGVLLLLIGGAMEKSRRLMLERMKTA